MSSLIEKTRKLGVEFIAPITKSVDKDGRFPKEAYDALRKQGFMGLLVPKSYGGSELSIVEHTQVCFELAKFDATTALCYMMHNTGTSCVVKYGSEAMKADFLPKIATGEIAIALAYSESGSGTHFGSPDLIEKQENGTRILQGRKSFVTSAQNADFYLTNSNSCKIQGSQNNWLVDRKLAGMIHEDAAWDGLGMRGNASMPVKYDNVRVDEKFLVGEEGTSGEQAFLIAMYFVVGLAAVYSGLGAAAYECVLQHSKTRKYTSGQALADVETVRTHIAQIYTKVQASYAFALEAARSFAANEPDFASKIFASRINATQNVMDVCALAMRVGGGTAYAKRLPLERYLRDAFASQVMAPSLDVLKQWLADGLLK